MKQAYERVLAYGGYDLVPIELLPKCKRVSRKGVETEYQLARQWFLGLIPYTKWVRKDDIRFFPKPSVEYYECNCGLGQDDE